MMKYYNTLKQSLKENNLNENQVMVIDNKVLSETYDKRFCIFDFSDNIASDFKYYEDLEEPNNIMMALMKIEK